MLINLLAQTLLTVGIAILAYAIKTLVRYDHHPTDQDRLVAKKSRNLTVCLVISTCIVNAISWGLSSTYHDFLNR
jgi:hypothetical protein